MHYVPRPAFVVFKWSLDLLSCHIKAFYVFMEKLRFLYRQSFASIAAINAICRPFVLDGRAAPPFLRVDTLSSFEYFFTNSRFFLRMLFFLFQFYTVSINVCVFFFFCFFVVSPTSTCYWNQFLKIIIFGSVTDADFYHIFIWNRFS